jgi:hypothetical protein
VRILQATKSDTEILEQILARVKLEDEVKLTTGTSSGEARTSLPAIEAPPPSFFPEIPEWDLSSSQGSMREQPKPSAPIPATNTASDEADLQAIMDMDPLPAGIHGISKAAKTAKEDAKATGKAKGKGKGKGKAKSKAKSKASAKAKGAQKPEGTHKSTLKNRVYSEFYHKERARCLKAGRGEAECKERAKRASRAAVSAM